MKVGGIFKILITIVACVVVGAIVLNVLMPNLVIQMVDAGEDMVFKATGMAFDINGNGNAGDGTNKTYSGDEKDANNGMVGPNGVEGFN